MTYYIGIDGGGTKTEGVLTDREGRILAIARGSATNPNDVTPEGSIRVLSALVAELMAKACLDESDLPAVSLFGGIAGGINYRDALLEGMTRALPSVGALDIRSDVHILLAAGLPLGDGACLICGTGSACFLRCGQEIHRIGGWGYLLDGGGSGYNIGRDALEAVLRAHDGRGDPTLLSAYLAEQLGDTVSNRITEIYRGGKPYIASCAPAVFAAAEQGDRMAESILNRNARYLAELIEAAWRKCSLPNRPTPEELPVVMGGSISIRQAPAWQDRIHRHLDPAVRARLFPLELPAVFGAIAEAAAQASDGAEKPSLEALRQGFAETYQA